MHIKKHDFVIPLVGLAALLFGGMFTELGIASGWYGSLVKPAWTPVDEVMGIVWPILYLLGVLAALQEWHHAKRNDRFYASIALFFIGALLSVAWSYAFFAAHNIFGALVISDFLTLTVLVLIFLVWRASRSASIALIPYLLWSGFAGYLNYLIWALN